MNPNELRILELQSIRLGLIRDGRMALVPYDERWAGEFLKEAQRVTNALNEPSIRLFHIGSTSIPGIHAKPILDILLATPSLALLDSHSAVFEQLGYECKGESGLEGRRYYVFADHVNNKSYVHLHAWEDHRPEIFTHLIFRDYLRHHPDQAKRYEAVKLAAIDGGGVHRTRYMEMKAPIIEEIMKSARIWAGTAEAQRLCTPECVMDDGLSSEIVIRRINPSSSAEIDLVATRMRQTLVEVLGEADGGSMYTMDWLRQRVLFHLDPKQVIGDVLVAEGPKAQIIGHAMVRIEHDKSERPFALFSTVFVEHAFRRQGVATRFLSWIEKWVRAHRLYKIAYYTAKSNAQLINLFHRHGFLVIGENAEKAMVILEKTLERNA
jgi:GrpB-like predicted nucleotidyltransferase (UPF0157 family)/GNAT superfamily N-acetyltransferase